MYPSSTRTSCLLLRKRLAMYVAQVGLKRGILLPWLPSSGITYVYRCISLILLIKQKGNTKVNYMYAFSFDVLWMSDTHAYVSKSGG